METPSPARTRIAVVGGGFTGLTAAYRLSAAGHEVEVFEASPTLGGLVAGFELSGGFPLERAYHFLYTTDEHMIGMAEELGIRDKLHFHLSSVAAFHKGRRYGLTTPVDLLKFRPLRFVDRIRTGLTYVRLALVRDWRPLTRVTAYEWLCRVNGKRATDIVWKPLLVGKFDSYWDKVTMAWLWTRIEVRRTSRYRGESLERLGYFDGGFRIMVERWVEELEAVGVAITTGAPVAAFGEADGRPTLEVGGETRVYDAVLAAVPSNVFARAAATHPSMTDDYREQLAGIPYLGAVLLILETSEPITDSYWHQIHDLDAPFLVFLSLDSLIGVEKTGGRHIYYIGDYSANDSELMEADEDEIRARWFDGLARMFPQFSVDLVRESHVFKFRNAQHVVDVEFASRIPDFQTPLPGFYLANFSQVFPEDRGTNYAVRDGKRVAELIHAAVAGPAAPEPAAPEPAAPEDRVAASSSA